jgi:hypothetical protein
MISIICSEAKAPSQSFNEDPRKPGEDNLQWLSRNMPDGDNAVCVLIGGTDPISFRLRTAQADARHDLMPSHWSHVMLLDKAAQSVGSTVVHEISLDPPQGFGFPPPTNGVQEGKLKTYRDPKEFPNIALLHIPVGRQEVMDALSRFQKQRAVLDPVGLIVQWLAYLWGVTNSPNPLLQRLGIPSAAMLEVVFGAAGYDITPGLESRSSCPEAIWQAAKWWHEYYGEQNRTALGGAYYVGHRLEGQEAAAAPPASKRSPAKKSSQRRRRRSGAG